MSPLKVSKWLPATLVGNLLLCLIHTNSVKAQYESAAFDSFFRSSFTQSSQSTETFEGSVGPGNYSYYVFSGQGPFRIRLNSVEGDADLYVHENDQKPTFDPANHLLQSSTCGEDGIEVPRYYKRPVVIGVYGHPGSLVTKYNLEVILPGDDELKEEIDNEKLWASASYNEEEESGRNEGYRQDGRSKNGNRKSKSYDTNDDRGRSSAAWDMIISILRFIGRIIFEILT